MSRDFVALLKERPHLESITTGLPTTIENGTTQLYDTTGRLLVHVAAPVQVTVPGEVERLLNNTTITPPIWWVEIRAASSPPAAEPLARAYAAQLIARHQGLIWTAATPP